MHIIIGSDHRGHDHAAHLTDRLQSAGHTVTRIAPNDGAPTDYPLPAFTVGNAVTAGAADLGVLICGTGIGTSIAANKIPGIRAAAVHDEITAELSRSHNNANVICMSADLLGKRTMELIVDLCLKTEFEGGRHQRRIDKITMIERGEDPHHTRADRNHPARAADRPGATTPPLPQTAAASAQPPSAS